MSRIDYELYKSVDAPGPGNYESPLKPATPSYSFQGKTRPAKPSETPGPGSYEPEKPKSKAPKNPFIGKAARGNLSQISDAPGPGSYNSNQIGKSPSWSFHGSSEISQSNTILGPGRYDVVPPKKAKPCTTDKSPRPDLFASSVDSPGPGQYSALGSTFANGTYSFGKGSRPSIKSPNPGPGAYEQSGHARPVSYSFGKDLKKTLTVQSESPFAEYDPKIPQKYPSYTFGVKVPAKAENSNPGPGSYELNQKPCKVFESKSSRSLRFPTTYHEKETSQKPGPGNYESIKGPVKPRPNMSKAERFSALKSEAPGPGQYDPKKPSF